MELDTMPCCEQAEGHGTHEVSPCLHRKNKPPNLDITRSKSAHQGHSEDVNKNLDNANQQNTDTPPFVTLRKQVVNTLGAGTMNSPVVKRSSRIGQILEIPDVAAALVHDEGYELLLQTRRCSFERSASSRRQQTPAATSASEKFLFEESAPTDGDSESTSGSDSSSLQSAVEVNSETSKHPDDPRPRLELSKVEPANAKDVYDRIADSTRPAELFGSPIEKKPASSLADRPPSPYIKKASPANSLEEDTTSGEPGSAGGKRTLFSRLRRSGLSRSPSNNSLQGWESLARALARVGVTPSVFGAFDYDSCDLNPTLTPILKRRSHPQQAWSPREKEPGTKPPLRKKTVSFSRLPSEASVKNSADCITLMQGGHQFVKMRSNARVYNRLYWLDEVANCLRWEPSKKDSGKARIDISAIREVRPGKTTELFLTSDISTHFPEECSFSIVYGDGKTLDLIANSADDANVWVTGLRCLMSGQDMEGLKMRADARDTWLSGVFDRADINGDGYLDEEESLKLLKSLSDGIRELRIKQKLQEHVQLRGSTERARLSKDDFVEFFKDVATRPEIYFLLARFASRDDRLSVDDLLLFLESEQGITGATHESCVELIETYEPSESLKSVPALGIDGFTKFLMSDECGLLDPTHLQVCQDMSQPLSHYFIASSHNTYLMEDQVSGPSSAGAYVRALLRCCRCVELDCWDGANGEPVVTHGHTPTNKVPFRQVVEAIKDSAFRNSPFPVILCLENHCSEKQQLLMAEDLTTVLGEQIYTETLADDAQFLPSPEALKNRFLIRSRKLPPECTEEVGYVIEDDEGQEVEEKIPTSPTSPTNGAPATPVVERRPNPKGIPLVRQLSDLVSICACVTFLDNFDSHNRAYSCSHTCSLNEQLAVRIVDGSPDHFTIHNKKYLTRVFPSGLRYDSSNFNPQDYWNCGVQIASLNYQTPGLMMDINDGRFSMNGSCGYVLKPSVMREPMAYYSTQHTEAIPGVPSKTLQLRIISGQNFPKPRGGGAKGNVIDPYVLIELFGVTADCAEQRTRTAPNNSGESPVFDESFEFRLTLPSLALVRFVVLDDEFIGDEFIGQYTIPFDCMRPGYRHLRLRSIFDEPLEDATLFIHVAVSDSDAVAVGTGGLAAAVSQSNASGGGTLKKRGSSSKKLKKTRSRKDIDYLAIRECAVPVLDDLLRKAEAPLRHATSLREAQRWSLSYLREACGAGPLASVKHCVRCMSQRLKSDSAPGDSSTPRPKRTFSALSADGDAQAVGEGDQNDPRRRTVSGDARLRRQASETSQTSTDSSFANSPVTILRQERRLLLELHGSYGNSEYWRKAGLALDAFVSDTLAVLDNAPACCSSLEGFCQSMEAFYDDIPKLISGNAPTTPTDGDSGVVNGGNGTPVLKKSGKAAAKKKTSNSLDGDRKRRQTLEENLRWNHSVVKGQAELLRACAEEASRSLADIWEAATRCSIASEKPKSGQVEVNASPNGLETADGAGNNRNGNNNATGVVAPQAAKHNGTKGLFGVAKHSLPPFTRARSATSPKFPKQGSATAGDAPYPVTPL